jgi:CheY-like chemotaxis protein
MLNILIVEDHKQILENLSEILDLNGYTSHRARDGLEGYQMACVIMPDVIIADIYMPHMDGFALLDALQKDERTAHIPVIFITAHVDPDIKQKVAEVQPDAFLPKPFEHDDLLKAIVHVRR